MPKVTKDVVLIECDIPTRVFIEKVAKDLFDDGVTDTNLLVENLDDTHVLVHKNLLVPLRNKLDSWNNRITFDRM